MKKKIGNKKFQEYLDKKVMAAVNNKQLSTCFRSLTRDAPVCIIESEKNTRLKSMFIKVDQTPKNIQLIQKLSNLRDVNKLENKQIPGLINNAINEQVNIILTRDPILGNIKTIQRSVSQVDYNINSR